MNLKPVISVEHLTKQYDLGVIGTGTISRDLNRWWARVRKQPDPYTRIGQRDAFERCGESILALDDVSFQVQQGAALGIIGRNGAGKSTLLKILSRVTAPTAGVVKVKGRIGSLLEVGTGFHPELTGRENVYLNGAILGMRKQEVIRKFDEIVDFAGVEKFIDTPVKRYSSGMYVRLAFAVAAHLDPEILIVDEVLAVGDAEFQKKCLGKMGDVASEGRTVLFVSHNMAAVQTLCNYGLVLDQGEVRATGNISDCIKYYLSGNDNNKHANWHRNRVTEAPLIFKDIYLTVIGKQPKIELHLSIIMESTKRHLPAFLAIDVNNAFGNAVMQAIPEITPYIDYEKSLHSFSVIICLPPMIPGVYSISLWAGSHNTVTYDEVTNGVIFEIQDTPTKKRVFPHHSNHGYIVPESRLEIN